MAAAPAPQEVQRVSPTSVFSDISTTFKSIYQWFADNYLYILGTIVVLGLIYIIYRLWKSTSLKNDVHLQNYEATKSLCRLNANPKYLPRLNAVSLAVLLASTALYIAIPYLLFENYVPLMLKVLFPFLLLITALTVRSGFMIKTPVCLDDQHEHRIIGFYAGECYTDECDDGFRNFMLTFPTGMFSKETHVLKMPAGTTYHMNVREQSKDTVKTVSKAVKLPPDLVMEHPDKIILRGVRSVKLDKYFLYPIFLTPSGGTVDLKLLIFKAADESAMTTVNYNLVEDYSKKMRDAVGINPELRRQQKTRGVELEK